MQPASHTPLIGGQKSVSIKEVDNKTTRPATTNTNNNTATNKDNNSKESGVQHFKKWGERTHSWKPAQFESVQALVEKGW